MSLLQNSNAISAGEYDVNNSLRFRASASAYLSRTPSVAGNRKTWTWSAWVKRGTLAAAVNMLFYVRGSDTDATYFRIGFDFLVANCLTIGNFSGAINLTTTQVFRDPSAWYHIVVAMDTTQATASNRLKLYVNGTQVTAFSTANYPSLNTDYGINNTTSTIIGASLAVSSYYYDGYMADVNFIDGSAKTPSDFGETDTTTGVWKPKKYTGTYGTNGFYLKFSDIATTSGSNAGLGKDFSGNTNYWTTNNISVTSGTTYDAMKDSPTNTSATVANYCVLNPLQKGSGVTLSNANLTWSTSGSSSKVLSTIGMSSGKYYCEFTMASSNGNYGVATAQTGISGANYLGDDTNSWCYAIDGKKYTNGSGTTYGATYTAGDIIGVAFDADAGTLTYYKNGTSQGTAFTGLTSGPYFFAQGADPSAGSVNFGQRPFSYTPPTGYVALNTYNLPTPTILQGNKYMDATLYSGNSSTQTIVNAGGFKPDLVWTKNRSFGQGHILEDSVRGALQYLGSESTAAESTIAGSTTSFNSNGFSVGSYAGSNQSGYNYVGWQWQAGQGSTSSNTSGSITSTVSVNTTAGFSVVTYTGTGANATVGHGLGVAPAMIIVKARTGSATTWIVYHKNMNATPAAGYLALNDTLAYTALATVWNSTAPTSTVFSIGTNASTGANTINYVAYCFAEIAGFSRFGSYTGNGSADGPFVFTNFRPKYILVKSTGTASWFVIDTARLGYNSTNNYLLPNATTAETTYNGVDILSNGFKVRNTDSGYNDNGVSYIYACFAENPFKNSLAR